MSDDDQTKMKEKLQEIAASHGMTTEEARAEISSRYASGKLEIPVSRCRDCPFFTKSLLSILASLKGSEHGGECRAPGPKLGGGIILGKWQPVEDCRAIPTWCPLRMGDVVVTLTT